MKRKARQKAHLAKCHTRWLARANRLGDEDHAFEQCGGCSYYIPLSGGIGEDWGVCSNAEGKFDGTVRCEHDGCDRFVEAPAGTGGAW